MGCGCPNVGAANIKKRPTAKAEEFFFGFLICGLTGHLFFLFSPTLQGATLTLKLH
jgi:hypothetical protein